MDILAIQGRPGVPPPGPCDRGTQSDHNRPVRILQVSTPDLSVDSGQHAHVRSLSVELAALGHEVTLVAPAKSSARAEPLPGVELVEPSTKGSNQTPSARTLRYLRDQRARFDVVHAQDFHALPLLGYHLAAGPLVVTPFFHPQDVLAGDRWQHAATRNLKSALLRRSAAVICVSDSEADLVARNFRVPLNSIAVVPSMIAEPSARVDVSLTHRVVEAGRRVVLSVGRLVPYKNVQRLVAAAEYLQLDHHVVVVGVGPVQEELVGMAEQIGLADRVHVLGRVTDDELEAWLHRADVLVSLSKLESFGRVLYDALAHGCAVVCSDIPAHAEAALRFPAAISLVGPSENPAELAAHVERMLSAPEPAVDLSDLAPEQVARRLTAVYGAVARGDWPPR